MVEEIHVNLPYPDFEDITEDVRSAHIISAAYAGLYGELSAILTYSYHEKFFRLENMEETKNLVESISVNEMRHFEILGSLILKLGVDPVYTTSLPRGFSFYNTSRIGYNKTPIKMLEQEINGELGAINDYENMLELLSNDKVSAVISRIILDEKFHVTVLSEQLRKISD